MLLKLHVGSIVKLSFHQPTSTSKFICVGIGWGGGRMVFGRVMVRYGGIPGPIIGHLTV